MRSTYSRRFFAALAFMLAGSATGLLVILYDLIQTPGNARNKVLMILALYLLTPGILGGISGFIIGADIFNPNKTTNAGEAIFRGALVSVAAWLAFAIIMSSVVARESDTNFIGSLLFVLIFGSILVGWLIALMGASTGLLLYRLRESRWAIRN